jgi:hypothetical protein
MEWWPLTYIPMYSEYRTVHQARPPDVVTAKAIAAKALERDTSLFAFDLSSFSVFLVPRDGQQSVPLHEAVSLRIHPPAIPPQSIKVWADAYAEGLFKLPPPGAERSAGVEKQTLAHRLLQHSVPQLRNAVTDWARFERIEVVADFQIGSEVLAYVELTDE